LKITLAHGSGGLETNDLIASVFIKHFLNEYTLMEDAAVLPFTGQRLAFTTDSYVVKPLFFPGGDIGRLAVCGTVNDLLTTGGQPLYISASFVIEENTDTETLDAVARSMREAADEAGVLIVTGDTKVIEGNGGLHINTAGVGLAGDVSLRNIAEGDAIIVSGYLGEHHACILSQRMGIENGIKSDAAPLTEMVRALTSDHCRILDEKTLRNSVQDTGRSDVIIHGLRDITRGGLATILNEAARLSGLRAEIFENDLPVSQTLNGLCKILGLDPLYMGNEGNMLVIVPEKNANKALRLVRQSRYGGNASIVGRFTQGEGAVIRTHMGGARLLHPLSGEGLPRIC
jgi:hydrogenase expression/formation protein HypE